MTVRAKPWKAAGRYQVDVCFRRPDKSQHRERKVIDATSAAAAVAWGEQRERILRAGPLPNSPRPSPPTFAAFVPRYLAKGRTHRRGNGLRGSESTLHNHIIPFIGHLSLDQLSSERLAELRERWAAGGYPLTTNGRPAKPTRDRTTHRMRLLQLHAVLRCAVDFGVIEQLPCKFQLPTIDKYKESAFYEPAITERLIAAASSIGPCVLAMVLLGCEAGLRCGEMLALRHDDVDYVRSRLHVRRSSFRCKDGVFETETKGEREQWVPMTPRLHAALAKLRDVGDPSRRVLWRDNGKPVTGYIIAEWMRHAERMAGMPITGRVHVLRHSFVTHLAMAGVPVLAVQALARHTSLQSTLRYMHLAPSAAPRGIELLQKWQKA